MMTAALPDHVAGHAAGVPFVALPPAGGPRASAPIVVAWHLLDAPRTEAALAAAVPLDGLDAWRVYLGMPLSGSRLPDGGMDGIMRLGFEDAVLKLDMPIAYGAAEELAPALGELRDRLGVEDGPIGVMGGSLGAAVAQLVLAEADIDVAAAVLISPVIQERRKIAAGERLFEFSYEWTAESDAVAQRLDFVARADELRRRGVPVLIVVGERDEPEFREPAAELAAALGDRAELVTVPGMAHALGDEPGFEPAPQTPHAAAVDRLAAAWFQRHVTG
jgi:pimeloyl-ACP methyl ester carboxylesterase